MAFNKENKITIKELAPSLIDLLNKKANRVDLDNHINNSNVHITPTERTKWNDSLNQAKQYTDTQLSKALGPIKDAIGDSQDSQTSLTTLLNQKLDKTTFESFRNTLHRVATSGSYNDLTDKPSGLAYSDTANKALKADSATKADRATNADHATNADRATNANNADRVGDIRITINNAFPSNPTNNKDLCYRWDEKMWYCYCSNGWQMTGAALR